MKAVSRSKHLFVAISVAAALFCVNASAMDGKEKADAYDSCQAIKASFERTCWFNDFGDNPAVCTKLASDAYATCISKQRNSEKKVSDRKK